MSNTVKPLRCRAYLELGDDHGDGETTFRCQLAPQHSDNDAHCEQGEIGAGKRRQWYSIKWGVVVTSDAPEGSDHE